MTHPTALSMIFVSSFDKIVVMFGIIFDQYTNKVNTLSLLCRFYAIVFYILFFSSLSLRLILITLRAMTTRFAEHGY